MLPSMPVLWAGGAGGGGRAPPALECVAPHQVATAVVPPTIQPVKNVRPAWQAELPTEKEEDINETNLVVSYYNKLVTKLKPDKFALFHQALNKFDPYKETPVDLYKKLQELCGNEHEELAEEFLLFLTPGQATDVGRFMDHLMLTNIMKFVELLQSTFSRKPAKLRKVMRSLTSGLRTNDSERLKATVLPQLRSSQRLTQYFLALFPEQRPPDSLYTEMNTEFFPESAWANDCGYDCWELEEPKESNDKRDSKDKKDSLDVKYLQGRVFLQQGRIVRPARVSFPDSPYSINHHARRLAPAHHILPQTETDDEGCNKTTNKNANKSPKRPRTKSPPAKNITKGAKNKSPERIKNPVKNKSILRVIDAEVEAKCLLNNTRKVVLPELNSRGLEGSLTPGRNTISDKVESKCKRKKELSPDLKPGKSDETKSKHSKRDRKKAETKISENKAITRTRKSQVEKSDKKVVKTKEPKADLKQTKAAGKQAKTVTVRAKSDAKQAKVPRKQTKLELKQAKSDNANNLAQDKLEEKTKSQRKTEELKPINPNSPQVSKSCSWTRDEDKTILQVLKGETGSAQTFTRIKELLPHRSLEEVRERFFHVMDLLQQMALGEVT